MNAAVLIKAPDSKIAGPVAEIHRGVSQCLLGDHFSYLSVPSLHPQISK
jgi:hypothetical protein